MTQRCRKFWGSYGELETDVQHDKFIDSFEDNYPGVCNGRSIWMIDCRKFDDSGCDKSLRIHVGRNPRIMRSIMESKNYHELHTVCLSLVRKKIIDNLLLSPDHYKDKRVTLDKEQKNEKYPIAQHSSQKRTKSCGVC